MRVQATAVALLGLVAMLGGGCEKGIVFYRAPIQWTVYIRSGAKHPEMGDRVFIQVLDEGGNVACDDCTKELDATKIETQTVTFGVKGTDSTVRVRAQLYRTFLGRTGGSRMIDVVGRLPHRDVTYAPDPSAKVDLELPFGCFGRAPDLAAGRSCQIGEDGVAFDGPEPTLRDQATFFVVSPPRGCTRAPLANMKCVGSGTFSLGDDRIESVAFDFPAKPSLPTRIAREAPLMMDEDEMRVGTVRKLLVDHEITSTEEGDFALLERGAAGTPNAYCTFLGKNDATNDSMPINCIARELAKRACDALKRRLPAELEFEFAASNAPAKTLYTWGDLPKGDAGRALRFEAKSTICDRAIVGRGRPNVLRESNACLEGNGNLLAGPTAAGSPKDITSTGIRNLAGNLAEWVSDEFAFYDEECFVPFQYPCRKGTTRLEGKWASYRGGSWASPPQATLSVARFAIKDGAASPYVGFRCAITEDELP